MSRECPKVFIRLYFMFIIHDIIGYIYPFLKYYETIEKPKKRIFLVLSSIVKHHKECTVLSNLLVGQIESSKNSSSDPDSSSSLSKLDSSSLDSSLSSSSSKEREKHC